MDKINTNERVEFLDFLRGLATLLVFLSHTHHLINIDFVHQFGNLFSRGVQLFYLVSGFTIYMIYIDKIQNSVELKKYLLRRFFRIMPLLFCLIPIYYFIFGLNLKFDSTLPDWYHILSHYTLLFGFHPDTMASIIPPAWSIFDEFCFYIVLSLVLLKFNIRLLNMKIVMFLFIISFLTFVTSNTYYSDDTHFKTFLFFSPLIQIYIFFIGGGIFIYKDNIKVHKIYYYTSLLILLCYSMFLNSTVLSVYLTVVLFSVVILYLSQNNHSYNKFFLFLGKISFSFYLIHYGVIQFFEKYNFFGIDTAISILVIFCLTILLSMISFKYIETFFINKGKSFIKSYYES